MGNQFAKLFERDGEQVLVLKERHEETDAPGLKIVVKLDWAEVSPFIQFKDDDRGLAARDEAFDKYTVEDAFKMRDSIVAQFGKGIDGGSGQEEEEEPVEPEATETQKPRKPGRKR